MAKECPIATHDIKVNLKNRDWAFKNVGYGAANPELPNKEFWAKKADEYQCSVKDAKTMRCGNCAAFIQTPEMMDCIVSGIQKEESDKETYANEVVEAAELGYCELFEFKCAADRTCSAWLVGGAIKDKMTTKQKQMLMMAKFEYGQKEESDEEEEYK
jgi:hypothetical protein